MIAQAKENIALLGVYSPANDSLSDSLAFDIEQSLAENPNFTVYGLRKKHGVELDKAFSGKNILEMSFWTRIGAANLKKGFFIECSDREVYLHCVFFEVSPSIPNYVIFDSLDFLSEIIGYRKKWTEPLLKNLLAHLLPQPIVEASRPKIHFNKPLASAQTVLGMQILQKGLVTDWEMGTRLVLGEIPLTDVNLDATHYVLYPNSIYTYLLPKVIQLNSGGMGLYQDPDSNAAIQKFDQATTLNKNNLIWKTLGQLAATDSSNLIWRALGKTTSLDSSNPIYKSIRNVTSIDSANMIWKTLRQAAEIDSQNLLWRGLSNVTALDSSNFIWQKLNAVASLDSNSIWKKLGLIAFQDSAIIITTSMIARGSPQALFLHQENGLTEIELINGSLQCMPLLSSSPGIHLSSMEKGRTRGYELNVEKLPSWRSEIILQEFASLHSDKSAHLMSILFPKILFGSNFKEHVVPIRMQEFMQEGFADLGFEWDILSSQAENWSGAGKTLTSGKNESGCYLCSPDRLGH